MPKKRITRRPKKTTQVPLECYFCKEKKEPNYADSSVLIRFITDRGKITARSRNGLCSKHQRVLGDSVKYARHLALLPFVIRD
jgi:small subunit ribosomal protein S18